MAFLKAPEIRLAALGAGLGAVFPATSFLLGRATEGDAGWIGATSASAAVVLMPLLGGALFYEWGRARVRRMREQQLQLAMNARLSQAVCTDQLTGIGNRTALEHDLTAQLSIDGGELSCGALLLLDLDRFKFVNDTLGHHTGDLLLKALSERLVRLLLNVATIYRLGGDEFAINVAGSPSVGKIEDICVLVKRAISEPFDLSGTQFWIGGSIGVAFPEEQDRSLTSLLRRADLALYRAKTIAGDSHAFYLPEMAAEADARSAIDYDLTRALASGEFYLEYQPIVGIDSGVVRAFEALIRWRHPHKGIIQPDLFIAAAEETGLILPIGNWVVRTACLEAARWPTPTGIAVNVAGDQFKDRAFVPHVKACLAEAGLAPGRLTIEVTESIFSVDAKIICDSLAELRAHGVRIALDDFGIGFSSINNLRRFPLDQLKVDRSFTHAMLGNKRDAELVDIILKLGHMFQVSTTIEGIETEHQLEFVRALGASEAQGFLISRPVSGDEALAILERPLHHGALRSAG